MTQEVVALAVMGIDQHENGVMAVSRVLMESQIQVEYLGTCQTPESVAEKAIARDADVIGISCHSWEYLTLVPQLLEELKRRASPIDVIIGGSVITREDALIMKDAGVAEVFTSSTENFDMVECVRQLSADRSNRL
ncbi:MAG: hypothetical protein HOC70_11090 [Gammaproteobacteria bacterium]|jgi:methylmalonyl-CoA mutase, C-terminal domain|nr:hypothetical protein [Gammaproteobacteria bacterium]MBT4493778.1 hypothetical protein [Gammaproteobacteria bacterium]MBT7369199.1 hypothetical protein [Gammaproteobacteria bacterium]